MPKSKAAVGVLAAACAASSSSAATAPPVVSLSSTAAGAAIAVGPCGLRDRRTSSSVHGIPRGGHSPASAEAAGSSSTKEGEKRRRKKKKRSKPKPKSGASTTASSSRPESSKQPQTGTTNDSADNESSNASSSNESDGSSSSSSPLPPAAQSILSLSCHYDILGITKSATQAEIQKAYRRRCVLTHPDKIPGGDRSAFDKVSSAYDVLGCEKKRAVYDRFGHAGIEGDIDLDNLSKGGPGGFGGAFGGFGNDVFREFFGADPFFGRRQSSASQSQQSPFRRAPPRNRDLRYQLEVTLEELYAGATKRVAIQQPDPLRPHFPFRKELEVTLTPGMGGGQSVRLSGVVDSVPDAAPADVVFLIRERRHRTFTRRGSDLAMEVKISFAESIVGFKRKVLCLDGREITISSPAERKVVQKEEVIEAPLLPSAVDSDEVWAENNNITSVNATATEEVVPEQITKTTSLSYNLPPAIIQTGDVHVLRCHGMPKRGGASLHHNDQFGDLYVQYVVEAPGSSSPAPSKANADKLTPEERVELARLLSKLEGVDDPTVGVIDASDDKTDAERVHELVHKLEMASATEFGRSTGSEDKHDEHLRHDEDDAPRGMSHGENMGDFFQQAFGGRSAGGFGGPFGLGGTGGGFRYFSSGGNGGSPGFGYGHRGVGEEDDHKVECNQM